MTKSKIHITDHACERYINRYNPALASITTAETRLTKTRNYIFMLFESAELVEVHGESHIYLNREYNLKFIFRGGKIVTLYPGSTKKTKRNNRRKSKVDNKYIIITMPDGSQWKLAYAVLLVRYMNYKGMRIRSLKEASSNDNIPASIEERIKLIRSEFTWSQIRDIATLIKPPREADYESGWRDGEMEIQNA